MRLSNEQKVKILNARIENLKSAIRDPNTFTHSIYESNSPKKDHIRAWAEALEQLHELGEYKDDITTISSHIRGELKQMGLNKAIVWAKQVLPIKYKDPAMIHAKRLLDYEYQEMNRGGEHPEKKKTKEQITLENKPYTDEIDKDISILEQFKKKLETTEFVVNIPPNKLDEYFTRKEGLRVLIRQAMDGRNKVLPAQLHLLLHAYTESTKNHAFSKYMEYAKEIINLTSKQAVRLLSGRVTEVELLYEPKNRKEARLSNFVGIQCPECGSFRMDIKYDSDATRDRLYCHACKTWNEIKTEKLMNKII